jgi:hypothetical protein
MFDYIENLRAKPKHQRRIVAFFVSLSVTALIFTSWAFFTLSNFQDQATLAKEKEPSFDSLAALRAGFEKSFQALVGELSVFKEKLDEGLLKSFLYKNSPGTESFYSSEEVELSEEEKTKEVQERETEEVNLENKVELEIE